MQYLKKEIKDRILASAVDEFKEHGFANASLRNIANNAERLFLCTCFSEEK